MEGLSENTPHELARISFAYNHLYLLHVVILSSYCGRERVVVKAKKDCDAV